MSDGHLERPLGRITVTTDAKSAQHLNGIGIRAIDLPDLDEQLIQQLVEQFETTIFPTPILHELARARRLAVALKRRGSTPRIVRRDLLPGDLTELVTTDAGRDAVRRLVADAPPCEFPEIDDEPDGTHELPYIRDNVLPPRVGELADHFAQGFDAKRGQILVALLAALAAALGADWKVGAGSMVRSAVLWFVLVAPAGMAKSPASKPLLKPLHDIDHTLGRAYRKNRSAYEAELRDWKRSKKGPHDRPEEPLRERVALTDVTPEGLAAALAASPRGILVHSDEIGRLLASMDAYHARPGAGRGFYLSLWSRERHAEGRKGADESESVDPFAVIYGTIQPSVVGKLELADGDGLCARFLWHFVRPAVHGLGRDLDPDAVQLWSRVIHLAREHRVGSVQNLEQDAAEYVDSRLRAWSAKALELDAADAGLLSSMYGKAGDHLMRLTALLHGIDAIEEALDQSLEQPPALRPRSVPLSTVQRAGQVIDILLAHGARVTELVLQHGVEFGTAAEDRQIEQHLRGLVPPGVEIEAEPTDWAEALALVGYRRSASKVGRAFARISGKRPAQLVVTRSIRGNKRGWCVRHLPAPDLASVVSEVSASPTGASSATDASDTNDTGRAGHDTPAVPEAQGSAAREARADDAGRPEIDDERRAIEQADDSIGASVRRVFDGAVRLE